MIIFPPDHPSYYSAGTIYFDYNDDVIDFLQQWESLSEKANRNEPHATDQSILPQLLHRKPLKISRLPYGYACIFEHAAAIKDLYIIQYQASRLYKKIVDEEIALGFLDHLGLDELRELRPKVY